MSHYIKKKIYLSDGQINKLKSAVKKKESITLQINQSKTPNHEMYLTKTQIDHIKDGKRINISKTQLEKNGGILPFLIPILASLGLGAASGVGAWGTKKVLDKITGSGKNKKKTWKGGITELGITNTVIEKNMKNIKGFRGIFMSDNLPKKIRKFENGIINLDVSTGLGTHWVCYYNDPKYDFVEYFDPFGEYILYGNKDFIPKIIEKYLSTSGKKIYYNSGFLQKPDSVKCGYYCMKYITLRNKGKSPVEVIYSFTQYPSHYNENFVNYK